MAGFKDAFYRKLEEHRKYVLVSGKYDVMPEVCQRYVGDNDKVAVLAIGDLVRDILHLRERTNGEISLVDIDPGYPYELIESALEEETQNFLPKEKLYYQTNKGLAEINNLFKELNVRCFVEQFPPLPKAIQDNSLDDIFIMSLLATPRTSHKWSEFCREMITAAESKLKPGGNLIVEESFGEDFLYGFNDVINRQGSFKYDDDYDEKMSSWFIYKKAI